MRIGRSLKIAVPLGGVAILLATAQPARTWLAGHCLRRGLEAREDGRPGSALAWLDRALLLRRSWVEARLERALSLQMQGDFSAAREELEAFADADLGDPRFHARYLLVAGSNLMRSGEAEAALERFGESAALARGLGDELLEARALLEMSYVHQYSLNREDEAFDLLRQVLGIARDRDAELFEAEALLELGQIRWWFRRDLEEPLTGYYLPALAIYRRHGMADHAWPKIAFFHLVEGDLFEYFRDQDRILAAHRRAGNLAGESEVHRTLGWTYGWLGNHRKAHLHLERSLELGRRTGDRFGRRRAAWLLARSYLDLGMGEEAAELLERNRDPDDMVYWSYVGKVRLGRGELAEARRSFHRALEMERESGGRFRAFRLAILKDLALAHMRSGELETAAEVLARSGELLYAVDEGHGARQLPVDDWSSLLAYKQVRAELLERQGRPGEAVACLAEAAEIASRTFRSAPAPLVWAGEERLFDRLFAALLRSGSPEAAEQVFSFLEDKRYSALRDLVAPWGAGRRGPPRASSAALERIREASRGLRERPGPSAFAALRRAYGDYEDEVLRETLSDPRYRLVRRGRPAELTEVRRRLAPDVALLVYVFAGDRVHALVVTRAAFDAVELPIGRRALEPKIKLFRRLLFARDGSGEPASEAHWRPVASSLRRALIEPVERRGLLDGAERLGLVPFGPLREVPFAALWGPDEAPRFLIEDYALFQTPSATFLTAESGGLAGPATRGMLAFGLREAAEPGLPSLDFAAAEARAVAAVYGGEARTGAGATEAELERLAPRFSILHLAAHGVAEPEMPLASRLLLGAGGGEDGSLAVREIFELELAADLVTLSGCNTGLSFPGAGPRASDAGRTGLIDAFLHAGAASVLASLLPVSDRPTTELMRRFYANLRTMDKAAALAETQRAMIRGEVAYEVEGGRVRLAHPRYWAPFVLVGRDR